MCTLYTVYSTRMRNVSTLYMQPHLKSEWIGLEWNGIRGYVQMIQKPYNKEKKEEKKMKNRDHVKSKINHNNLSAYKKCWFLLNSIFFRVY